MMHLLFESMPFVVGGAYGMVVPRSGLRGLWPNLVIGAFCACFAGELTQGATEAVVCLAADSAAALVSGSLTWTNSCQSGFPLRKETFLTRNR
jgi:hypothetical protein